MRLALSSAAAPDLDLSELLETCGRRGIEAVELVAGHAHGVAPGLSSVAVAKCRREIDAHEVRISALYLAETHAGDAVEMARLSVAFGVPLVVPAALASSPVIVKVDTLMAAEGGRLLFLHDTREARAALADGAGSARCGGFAWQVNPYHDDLGMAAEILEGLAGRLDYIRLLGSGPETAQCSGRGLGALMARLALSRYAGYLALAPSTARFHYAWSAWLGRKGGWGCGSAGTAGSARAIHALQPV